MAKKPKQSKGKKSGGGIGMVLSLFLALVMLIFMSYGGLLIVLGLMPSFVAFYVDKGRGRDSAKVVMTCNVTGLCPFIIEMFQKGVKSSATQSLIFDPFVWLSILGFSAFGWVLVWAFPRTTTVIMDYIQTSHIKSLEKQQQDIIDEWGPDVEASVNRANLRKAALAADPRRKEMFMKAKNK